MICLPVVAAVSGETPPGLLDYAGAALWLFGMTFEVVGDYQLARFQKSEHTESAVLDTGLWRYTRHPNYFGDAALWWGFYLIAAAAGGFWAIFSPTIMTLLLRNVSGVAMLEKTLRNSKPGYQEYVESTNAFIPWFPKQARQPGN